MSEGAKPDEIRDKTRTRKVIEGVLKLAFGVGLLVVVLRWLAPNWTELAASVQLDPTWALVGLLGTTLASFATAARWQLLAEAMGGTKLPFVAYFFGLVVTRLAGQFTSTMGMDLVGRGLALQSAGSERGLGHAATQVVLERVFDGVLPLLLLAWAFAVRDELLPWDPLVSLAVICIVFVVLAIPLLLPGVRVALWGLRVAKLALRWFKNQIARLRGRPVTSMPASTDDVDATTVVDTRLASMVALYSVARFATVILQFWGIALAVGIDIDWLEMTAATPVAQLAGMLGLTPGGLGFLEAGWAVGLGMVGFGSVAISLFVLAQRVGVITNFGLLSALSWPLARRAALARPQESHANTT